MNSKSGSKCNSQRGMSVAHLLSEEHLDFPLDISRSLRQVQTCFLRSGNLVLLRACFLLIQ